uniref:Uncharacterized protein n=1 Tax=Tetraselmis sp. GSL018 TaxID=582737 RepID=A0A061RC23_9CHLO
MFSGGFPWCREPLLQKLQKNSTTKKALDMCIEPLHSKGWSRTVISVGDTRDTQLIASLGLGATLSS